MRQQQLGGGALANADAAAAAAAGGMSPRTFGGGGAPGALDDFQVRIGGRAHCAVEAQQAVAPGRVTFGTTKL